MYTVEIWRYHHIVEIFEAESLSEIKKWFQIEWLWMWEIGECAVYAYTPDHDRIDTVKEGFFD